MDNQPIFITKDSGERRDFSTGARRDVRTGKGRYDLISPVAMRREYQLLRAGAAQLSPVAMRRECQLLERGAIKYGDRNWEKGMPISVFIDSGLRHIFNYLDGEMTEDHLSAGRWNLGCAMHMEEKHPELQDIPTRPEYVPFAGISYFADEELTISTNLALAITHITEYLDGDAGEDHLALARWYIGCAMQAEEKAPQLQDIPARQAPILGIAA